MIRRLLALYAASWMLLLSHALCIGLGAAWMYLAIKGVLKVQGVL